MRNRLFIDTWGWLKIFGRREARHEEVAQYYRRFRKEGGWAFTTDYVLDETLTQVFLRLPFPVAVEKYERIEAAREAEFLEVKWITPDRFDRAMDLRQRYDDKPDISFTDLSSMAVMQEVGLRDVLTGDAHFEHVGLGFRLRP
jgi:predicted nucleic acid-binding protein